MKEGKVIIISAPSGTGKSTVARYLLSQGLPLQFSVSFTSRKPREGEVDGRDYHFISPEKFRALIEAGDLLEYEEVYDGYFYGTLRSETQRIIQSGDSILLDIDVYGGVNVKDLYDTQALSIFLVPPSIDELRRRLLKRAADSPEVIETRIAKAQRELNFAPSFDLRVVNDDIERAQTEILEAIKQFISQ